MTKYATLHFNCPHCNALYQAVKTEAGPEIIDRWVTCRACHGPLPAREGKFKIKYFPLRHGSSADTLAKRH
jgi:hypothetical protein